MESKHMSDIEKMKKAVEFNGYDYEIFDPGSHCSYIALSVVGLNSGHRLAYFEFNKEDGSFRLEE